MDNITAERLAYAAATRATDYSYDLMNVGEAARALNIVFITAQKLAGSSTAQRILEGAMARTTDDTFAKRLLEYTQRDRNKILIDFSNIDADKLKHAFIERMHRRYGPEADIRDVDITTGDWYAFRTWAESSAEDADVEQAFWRRFIGQSRKRLAQAINLIYPGVGHWSEDPRPIISKLLPVDEIARLLQDLQDGEHLDEIETSGIARFEALLEGNYPQIGQF